MPHQAAWIKSKGASLEIGSAETPKPEGEEILINIKLIAFNPIEPKLQRYISHELE
jgi:NADPH:quinone reductase-like Zn-dependent oxidoreductase